MNLSEWIYYNCRNCEFCAKYNYKEGEAKECIYGTKYLPIGEKFDLEIYKCPEFVFEEYKEDKKQVETEQIELINENEDISENDDLNIDNLHKPWKFGIGDIVTYTDWDGRIITAEVCECVMHCKNNYEHLYNLYDEIRNINYHVIPEKQLKIIKNTYSHRLFSPSKFLNPKYKINMWVKFFSPELEKVMDGKIDDIIIKRDCRKEESLEYSIIEFAKTHPMFNFHKISEENILDILDKRRI